jgi:hypothetical protein
MLKSRKNRSLFDSVMGKSVEVRFVTHSICESQFAYATVYILRFRIQQYVYIII